MPCMFEQELQLPAHCQIVLYEADSRHAPSSSLVYGIYLSANGAPGRGGVLAAVPGLRFAPSGYHSAAMVE